MEESKCTEKAVGDLYLAAAFLSYNIPLIRIENPHSRRQSFIFCGTPKCIYVRDSNDVIITINHPDLDEVKVRFVAESLLFPPSYPDAIRRIKSSIHSGELV